jgi:hypothetical protein
VDAGVGSFGDPEVFLLLREGNVGGPRMPLEQAIAKNCGDPGNGSGARRQARPPSSLKWMPAALVT